MNALQEFLDGHPGLDKFVSALGGTSDEVLGVDVVLFRLAAACLLGGLIGRIYRRTFTGVKFSPTLPDTHMLLCLGGAMIWLVVGNSFVRAFGLAGTIGLVRFRTVVRDPKDTVMLLFSIIIGMACGLGYYPVAVVSTIVVLVVLVWMHYQHQTLKAVEAAKSKDLLSLLDSETPSSGGGKDKKGK